MDWSAFNINLKSLECFRAIMATGSATAAARHLGLTQPGVSRLLGVLEQQLGFELFYREKGRLIPTEEALTLHPEVELALDSLERVTKLARGLKDSETSALRIVAPPSVAEGILSDLVSRFLARHPNVQISLDSHSVETATKMVALRAVDCGFLKLPVDQPGLTAQLLFTASTVCALASHHPLAAKKTITAKDLENEPLILLGKGRHSRVQIENAFAIAGVKMRVQVETHTIAAACAFARRETGIALVNETLAQQYAGESLVFRTFVPEITHDYAFVTSAHAPMTRTTRKFFNFCTAFFHSKRTNPASPATVE
ncbi:LysR family transcriptional regulator [Microbulbifer magnicolonia]|uniref:LysR family transcriptional regulator n=1 Tax=Microbulbifer magnicolonia TaxID=3109744 RepID=UPI002B408830|nr:LysR family transcriptional regulator [Microbulbifer sp. GG15]